MKTWFPERTAYYESLNLKDLGVDVGDVVIFEYEMPYATLPRRGRVVAIKGDRVRIESPSHTGGGYYPPTPGINRSMKYFWRETNSVCCIGGSDKEIWEC